MEQLLAAMVVEDALDAGLGALSALQGVSLSPCSDRGRAVMHPPALGEQRVTPPATIAAALAGGKALDQGVQVDGCSGGGSGREC